MKRTKTEQCLYEVLTQHELTFTDAHRLLRHYKQVISSEFFWEMLDMIRGWLAMDHSRQLKA